MCIRDSALHADTFGQTNLDDDALGDIARDLRIAQSALVAAIADSRAGVLRKQNLLDRIVGPSVVWSNRSTTIGHGTASERVAEWLATGHGLRPHIRPDGVIVAQKRTDLAGKLGSQIRLAQGLGDLSKASRVQAVAVGTSAASDEPRSTSVCLAADIGNKRNEAVAAGSAVAIGATVALGLATTLAGPITLIGLPVAWGAGGLAARLMHRTSVSQMADSVERTMDGFVRGDAPPSPLSGLKSTGRRAIEARRAKR